MVLPIYLPIQELQWEAPHQLTAECCCSLVLHCFIYFLSTGEKLGCFIVKSTRSFQRNVMEEKSKTIRGDSSLASALLSTSHSE